VFLPCDPFQAEVYLPGDALVFSAGSPLGDDEWVDVICIAVEVYLDSGEVGCAVCVSLWVCTAGLE